MHKWFRVLAGVASFGGFVLAERALLYAVLMMAVVVGSHLCRPDSDCLACQALFRFTT